MYFSGSKKGKGVHHHGRAKHTELSSKEKNMRRRQSTLQMFVPSQPTEELRNLFWAAEYGDTPSVEAILNDNPNIDADAVDMFGRTAIHIAVVNEHAEIVELLLDLSSPVNLYEALLLAINHNYENLTELILKHPTYRPYQNRWPELAAKLPETSPFSDDISPIILACQKNLFGIVYLLWREGMRVPKPHEFDCSCERCAPVGSDRNSRDQLKHAKRRLNEYRALTSEAYISLTSRDPFQTAFELSRQMKKRAAQEKHFKREYKELVGQLSRYVVKLLDCVRTHHELQVILNFHGSSMATIADESSSSSFLSPRLQHMALGELTVEKYEPLSRLRVAIQYKQKEFVAHWSCQQELMRKWLRGFNQHQGASGQTKIFLSLLLTLLTYPVLMLFHWILPDTKLGKIISKPLVKFVAYSVSYLVFLGVLCFVTINPNGLYNDPEKLSEIEATVTYLAKNGSTLTTQGSLNHTVHRYCAAFCGRCIPVPNQPAVDSIGQLTASGVTQICSFRKNFVIRPRADNWMSWVVSIWLLGLLLRKLFEIITRDIPNHINERWASFFRSPFDFIDYVVLAVFAAALSFRFYSYDKTACAVKFFATQTISNSSVPHLPNMLYWINADRFYFDPLDPLTCSELLFAIGAVFSFSRLLYIFPVLEVFGPCYLGLLRVINDIFAFFFVFLVVFAAFMIGTMNVYWYFNPKLRHLLQLNSSYQPDIPAEKRFGNIELTFRTVFWSLFGLGESDYMNLQNFANGSMIWVERIGYIMYGGYSVVVVCVLLNMLIAMMANSYETIKENSETEWKYARTILFLEYIPDNTPAVPTPFNLVPNPRYLWRAFREMLRMFRQRRRRTMSLSEGAHDHDDQAEPSVGNISVTQTGEAHGLTLKDREDYEDQQKNLAVGSLVAGIFLMGGDGMKSSPKFNDVLHKILRRFILGLTIQGNSGTVDLEEIKQDISSFRFELLNIFSTNSNNVANSRSAESLIVPPRSHNQQSTTNATEQCRPRLDSNPNLSPRSPRLLLRRSIAPYRRRHIMASAANDSIITSSPKPASHDESTGERKPRLYSKHWSTDDDGRQQSADAGDAKSEIMESPGSII